jgi:hypothetical protein
MALSDLQKFTKQFSQRLRHPAHEDESRLEILLSQAYQEWERQTQLIGVQQAWQRTIISILTTRFGLIDDKLEAIIPLLLELPIETAIPLLLQLSREELLQRFSS